MLTSCPLGIATATGIPGYAGHVPHGASLDAIGARSKPLMGNRPHTAPMQVSVQRAPEYKALDISKMPKRMPLVGYTGHLRRTKESQVSYGTSHWRPAVPPTRAAQAALAYEKARQMAIDAHRPSDYKWNDPFAGMDGKKGSNPYRQDPYTA
mmetsp:Transcript_69082/g.136981  ORF Transcript_69082/g.136981 Transcript_69082/m.136981 type:complete len:152 (+) Transcript_69082:686-1141(+)